MRRNKNEKIIIAVLSLVMLCSCGPAQSGVKITKLEELEGKKIAVQELTTGDEYVTNNIKEAEVVRFKKAIDCGVDLKNGKVDAVVIDALPAAKIVEQLPELTILSEELTKEEYAIAVRKEDTELLKTINETLAEIKSNRTYDKFVGAFMPSEGEKQPLEKEHHQQKLKLL